MKKIEKLATFERRLNYSFKQKQLLLQALTHKSADHIHNERLEFLGDAILNLVMADELYKRFPAATEGQLTRARASLVNKKTLSMVASELTISDYIQLGTGEKRSGGFRRESILADAVEAILGAIYIDSGYADCQKVLNQCFESRLSAIEPHVEKKDPKTYLQELLQAQHHALPLYTIINIEGEPHAQTFTVCCEVEALSLKTEGVGPSRRIAEQEAAQKILDELKNE